MGRIYQVMVRGLKYEKMVDLCNTEEQMQSMTVLQLKEKILERCPNLGGSVGWRLIFADRMLDDDSALLSVYGITHLSWIQMVAHLPGGGEPEPGTGGGGMGDKDGRNASREKLANFETPSGQNRT